MLSRLLLATLLAPGIATPAETRSPPETAPLPWRALGPTVMGGRIVDLAVHPERPFVYYVASASGGVFATDDAGATFRPIFDEQSSLSIGAIALAPSRPSTLWVGTGEANPRNSVSWGDGVYKSEDGGSTWVHCGLEDSRHVGAIAIHPHDPNVVYVAAMGHTWGPNETRGLYRSLDGGRNFERVLYIDEHTGCIEVLIDPRNPDVVLAATWQRQRDSFDGGNPAVQTGPGSGLWRSNDGGDSFERVTTGLPTSALGRIGLDRCASKPNVLYAIVQTELTGRAAPNSSTAGGRAHLGVRGHDADPGYAIAEVIPDRAAAAAGVEVGDVLFAIDEHLVDDGDSLRSALGAFDPEQPATLRIRRNGQELDLAVVFGSVPSTGEGFSRGMQGGQSANAGAGQGSFGFETGGVFRSEDGGESWERVNSLNPRPFYYSQVRVDPGDDRVVWVCGIRLHKSTDGGRRFGVVGGDTHPDHHALWIDPRDGEHVLLGNDGGLWESFDGGRSFVFHPRLPIAQFYAVAVDDRRPYRVYGGLQDNGTWAAPSSAPGRGSGVTAHDWFRIGGGDGFRCAVDPNEPDRVYCESQHGMVMVHDLASGSSGRVALPRRGLRFHWNTPFQLSPHDSEVLWVGASDLIRVRSRTDAERLGDGVNLTQTDRGSASALSESPRVPGRIYLGTDDGWLWRTDEAGERFARISDGFPDVPPGLAISDVEASRYDDERVYVCIDGHRSDDVRPYLLRSDDAGYTWTALHAGLPENGSVRCVIEDPRRDGLLYVGTEFGCFVSLDAGSHWQRLGSEMPAVAVHDLVVQERERELVAATHGRGLWVLDVLPLQQWSPSVLQQPAHLFSPRPSVLWDTVNAGTAYRTGGFEAEQSSSGAVLHYWLAEDATQPLNLRIRDLRGRTVSAISVPGDAGFRRAVWDFRGMTANGRGRVSPGQFRVELIGATEEPLRRSLTVLPSPTPVFQLSGERVP